MVNKVRIMKTHLYIIALIASLLMVACTSSGQKEEDVLKTIHVEVDNIRTDVKLSEFAEARIIPLPTSDDLLIGNISRIRTLKIYLQILGELSI